MGLEGFDSALFTKISIPFAIALIIFFVAWLLVNRFIFKWRPALLGRMVISHRVKSDPQSFLTTIYFILYWIFFLAPFLLFLAWGGVTAYLFKPYYFGIIIGFGPTAILLIMYIYFDYHYRGFVSTVLSKIGLIFAFIVIIAITVGSVYFLDRQSWMEISYLFAFPPSLFFMISYTYSHSFIPNEVFEYALESQEKMDDFVESLSNRDETCFKGSKKLNVKWSIANVVFSLVCNFLYQLNYWFKDKNNVKGEQDSAFFTAIGFFLVDFLLLLAQAGTKIRPSFFFIIFFGYVAKIAAISFNSQYWIAGHGIVFFFLSTFLLVRFIMGFWKPSKLADLRGSEEDEKVKKLSEIMNKTRKIPKVTVILSAVSWVILIGVFIAEVVTHYDKTTAELPFDMSQIDALIGLVVLSVPLSLMICSCYYLYNNRGYSSVGVYVMYFLSIAVLVLFDIFWQGAKNFLLIRLLVPVVFIFIFSFISFLIILYYQKEDSFKRCVYLAPFIIYLVISVISLVLSIALPYGCQKYFKQEYNTATKLSCLIVVLIVLTILFYYFFVVSFLKEETMKNTKTIISFVLSILCVVGLGLCTGSLIVGLAVFFTVIVIFCLAFAFSYTKYNDWNFTLLPYLTMAIPSFIIFVLAIAAIFKMTDDHMIFLVCLLSFIFAAIFFGSSLFFWLQRKNFYFNWASILSLIMLVICACVVIVFISLKYKRAFIVISIILLSVFIASLMGMLCFVLSQSIANVIVVTNVFFPIRRLVDGKLKNISMFNVLYCLTFVSCWFWGLFGSIFFDNYPELGPLASTGAILLIGFITCFFITQFDSNTFTSLEFIHKEEIKYAVDTAMQGSNIDIELVTIEKPESDDYYEYLRYVEQTIQAKRNVSLFLSSLKAELYISSDVSFRSVRNQVRHFFRDKDYTEEELDFLTYETGWSNSDKIKIYSLLLDIKDDPTLNAKGEEYDNNVKQQVENRMKMQINTSADNKEFKKNVSKIESNNEKFNDPEYNSKTDKDSFTQSHWKRMEDIYTSQMFDASKTFNPNMIKQGSIGDCYLISSMVAVSKSTKLVQQMFTDPINNNAGMRCVNLHIMGKIVPVVVDTTIPFNGQSEHAFPIGCKPVKSDDQWWATIVEKAFAKQYGSYKAISGGNSHIAMYRMVGGFPVQYDMTDMKVKEMVQNGSMWKMLLKWHNQGDFICTGSKSGNDQDKTPQGINYGHAYTVLRVVEIQGYKLLQLRNPWGSGEWTGDWGDKSSKWTPRLRSLLNVTNEQDGIFWMSFDDYTNNFRSIYASIRLNDKYKYQLDGSFNCDEKDGASPFANGETDALKLPQWIIRCKSSSYQPTLHCIFEKSGGSAYCDVLLVYHNGSKLKYLQSGVKFNNFGMPHSTPLISFQWLYEEPSKPINLLIYRKKLNEPTTWHFEINSEAELEITKLE